MSATDTADSGVSAPPDTTPRLKRKYLDEIRPKLHSELGVGNVHQVPTLSKIVVNMGIGEAINDSKALEGATRDLSRITGQKPAVRRARKSIAGFKLREGMPVGVKVTLRGDRMWEFFDRTLSVALPRIRDFRGLKSKLDGRGNYTFGLTEQMVYPEISYDEVDSTRGMDVTIVTTAETDEHGRALLEAFGFPFTRGG